MAWSYRPCRHARNERLAKLLINVSPFSEAAASLQVKLHRFGLHLVFFNQLISGLQPQISRISEENKQCIAKLASNALSIAIYLLSVARSTLRLRVESDAGQRG
eukprot:scaffold366846_cov32-Prasinocladus_malaysianus.AAC.1